MFKYSVLIFVEKKYKMQNLEGSGTPVLYIGCTVLKGYVRHILRPLFSAVTVTNSSYLAVLLHCSWPTKPRRPIFRSTVAFPVGPITVVKAGVQTYVCLILKCLLFSSDCIET